VLPHLGMGNGHAGEGDEQKSGISHLD
jgi:hypothetical protein